MVGYEWFIQLVKIGVQRWVVRINERKFPASYVICEVQSTSNPTTNIRLFYKAKFVDRFCFSFHIFDFIWKKKNEKKEEKIFHSVDSWPCYTMDQ